jgi:hypothetical protein
MAINKDSDNVKRLVEAGILDDHELKDDGRKAINAIDLTDAEISALVEIKSKLKLDKVKLEKPGSKVWRL